MFWFKKQLAGGGMCITLCKLIGLSCLAVPILLKISCVFSGMFGDHGRSDIYKKMAVSTEEQRKVFL